MKNNQNGITLVELLIVIVVLGVISSVAVFSFGNLVENTRVSTDEVNAERLNQSTRLFKISNPDREDFYDQNNSWLDLMTILNEEGFLDGMVEPLARDGEFSWDFDNQIWLYNQQYILSGDAVSDFDPNFFGGNTIQGPYRGTRQNIVIPDIIDGNDILEIYQDAFRYHESNTDYSQTQLTTVNFTTKSQLERIHRRAFKDNDINSIIFPSSLNRIDGRAFIGNNTLDEITIGSGVTLEENVFRGGDAFKDAYKEAGAGTYQWIDDDWVKQQ